MRLVDQRKITQPGITRSWSRKMKQFPIGIVSTQEAARRIGVSPARVRQINKDETETLRGKLIGQTYYFDVNEVEAYRRKPIGRPRMLALEKVIIEQEVANSDDEILAEEGLDTD